MPEVAPSKEGLDNPGLVVGDEDLEAGKETETKFTPIDVDYGDKKTKEKEEENSSAITFEDLPTKDSTTASLLNWNTLMVSMLKKGWKISNKTTYLMCICFFSPNFAFLALNGDLDIQSWSQCVSSWGCWSSTQPFTLVKI